MKTDIVPTLVDSYHKGGFQADVKDAPAWMSPVDKMIVVYRSENRSAKAIMTVHCINSKENRIVSSV